MPHKLLVLLALVACEPPEDAERPSFEIRPGVEVVSVVGAEPKEALTLYDPAGEARITLLADELGQAHFAYVPDAYVVLDASESTRFPLLEGGVLEAGDGYVIRADDSDPPTATEPFRVMALEDLPDPSLYDQELHGVPTQILPGDGPPPDPLDGFQYIEVRDGTLLSAMVRFPDPLLYGEGPWPTVVEYSGYSPSRPSRPDPAALIGNSLGYAVVSVNLRGSGCSGGVFDVFNRAQHADGYDVIETVARQDWVLGDKVGMVGLSYPGITQLYVASTNPPSLGAVIPLSVTADAWQMQWPGGIYNEGFTDQWVGQREADAAIGGASWVVKLVEEGDEVCEDNVELSAQNIDFRHFLHGLWVRPRDADDRDLNVLVRQIEAPVFLAGAFQDEQTGAAFGNMLDKFDSSRATRFTLYNGRHPDGYSPGLVYRWWEFLELYVAQRVPRMNPALRAVGPSEFASSFDVEAIPFEEDRFADFDDDDYDGVLEAYEQESEVRVLFEWGAGSDEIGAPIPRYEAELDVWPPDAPDKTWYFDAGERLVNDVPASGADAWRFDESARNVSFFADGYHLTPAVWDFDWTEFAPGDLVSYLTPEFDGSTVVAGPGVASLWLRAQEEDVTVQVSLSEVRTDGKEVLLQSGWLRLGHRAVQSRDGLRIERSYAEEDFEPVPLGEWVQADVAIPSVAHAMRAGSRMRVTVSAPGRNHGTWGFEPPEFSAPPTIEIGRGGDHASSLTMMLLDVGPIPEELAPCAALRGQACREFRAVQNTVSE